MASRKPFLASRERERPEISFSGRPRFRLASKRFCLARVLVSAPALHDPNAFTSSGDFMRRLFILLTGLAFLIGNGLSGQTPKQKEELESLVRVLKTAKDPKARVNAANEMAQLGLVRITLIKAAEPTLIAALKDDNGEVRQAVVGALIVLEP